jgi:MSHA biogenesis protein MshJ
MKHWHLLLARVNRASLRERGLVFAAGVMVLATLWQQGLMGPLEAHRARLEVSLRNALEHPGEAGADGVTADYVSLRTREIALEQAIAAADGELQEAQHGMVAPRQMVQVLTDLLKAQGRLQLVLLKNLPVQSLAAAAAPEAKPAALESGPYLHPVELVVRGDYLDVLNYLKTLEAAPWAFQWRRFEFTTDEAGAAYRIQFLTLSIDPTWIGV